MSRGQRRARASAIRRRATQKTLRRARRTAKPAAVVSAAVTAAFTLGGPASPQTSSEAGPQRVRPIAVPGHPSELTAVGDTLFFTLSNRKRGRTLWKTDGTASGTVMVKDPRPHSGNGSIYDLTAVGGRVFFTASDGSHGRELWKSDGTPAGTAMVKDIVPDHESSYPFELTNVRGTLYFTVDDGVHGQELWKSNGTRSGTVLVKDVLPGAESSVPMEITAVGDRLFFTADDGSDDRDLWRSDGTRQGTVLVKDIGPNMGHYGEAAYDPDQLTAVGRTLFFVADDDIHGPGLWKSDGTTSGTVLVKDTTPGSDPTGGLHTPHELVPVGNRLFFTAHDAYGEELWVSNGTTHGTRMVKDLDPGGGSGVQGATYEKWTPNLAAVDGVLFFAGSDGVHGRELWKTDGTAAGTVRLTLLPNDQRGNGYYLPSQGAVRKLMRVGKTLYFVGNDDGNQNRELWSSDGTRAGTARVADINPGPQDGYPYDLTRFGGTLFFTAYDGGGIGLWKVIGPGPSCNGIAATRTGSGTITGTSRDDIIVGSGRGDRIDGRGGHDVICGGGGDDRLIGGRGRDGVGGGRGADFLDVRDGIEWNDHASGGPGRDRARGDHDDMIDGVP